MNAQFAELLRPYSQSKIAEHVGVSRSTVHSWAHGETFPTPEKLPPLAEILRVDLVELTSIVAEDSRQLRARRASIAGVA